MLLSCVEYVCESSLQPLDINIFEYVGVFSYASMNEREYVCGCIHSDYRLWYSASSLTLVYTSITTADGKRGSKKLEDVFSVKEIPPCQVSRAADKQEI